MTEQVPRFDTIGLFEASLFIRQILQHDEQIYYSCKLEKFNRYGFT